MKPRPILFARGNNEKVLDYVVEVEGNKFRTITGAVGFQHVTSDWTICEAKNVGRANSTTSEEQAVIEAVAKWEKKKKSGGYWEDIKDIDKSKFIEPMLAYPAVDSKHDRRNRIKFPCMVDRKYNGGRIVRSIGGAFTRKGEKYLTIPHIIEATESLFEKWPDLVLDGEGYNHSLRYHLNEIMSILRTSKNATPELLTRSKEIVKLYVYDGYGFFDITEKTPCHYRRVALNELLKGMQFIEWVPFNMATSLDEVYYFYNEYVSDGYEGAIVRNCDAPYQHKRTNDLLKIKPEDDAEAIIIKINEGNGNAANLAATATIRMKDGREFDATFKGEEEARQDILKHKNKWLGKEITFLYNGVTGKNIPNFARIDINNCFKK